MCITMVEWCIDQVEQVDDVFAHDKLTLQGCNTTSKDVVKMSLKRCSLINALIGMLLK